jgi:hypothetical protein
MPALAQSLAEAARLLLLSAVLTALPTSHISLVHMPASSHLGCQDTARTLALPTNLML